MINEKFWNECTNNSLRKKVAEFLDKNPFLSELKDEQYYEVEDAFVDFIHSNGNLIMEEIEKEYHREDVLSEISTLLDLDEEVDISQWLSMPELDRLVDKWQGYLTDSDWYWDTVNNVLFDVLTEDEKIKQLRQLLGKEEVTVE